MIWDVAVTAMTTLLDANTQLSALAKAERAEHGPRQVPGLRYSVLPEREGETTESVLVQLDLWANDRDQAALMERLVRRTLDHKRFRAVGAGIVILCLFQESRDGSDPQPGVVHRSLDFRYVLVRKLIATS